MDDDLDAAYHFVWMTVQDIQANGSLDDDEAQLVRGLKATLKLIKKARKEN